MKNKRRAWLGMLAGLALVAPFVGQNEVAAGGARERRLLLMNTLDSLKSVQHSIVGADFEVLGTPVFQDGKLRTSMGTVDDESVLLMPAEDFFGVDRTQGTVSVWLNKQMVSSEPYVTPFNGVFGSQPYDNQDLWCILNPVQNPTGGCTDWSIAALWGDGLSGPAGLYFQIVDSGGTAHQIVDAAFNTEAVPVGRWVHLLFVWDLDGIKGSADTMRIIRDRRVVASTSETIADVIDLPTPVAFGGSHATYRHEGPSLLYDQLMVFSAACPLGR